MNHQLRDELRYILDPKEVHGDDFIGESVRVVMEKEIMATYKQIQARVKQNYGFMPETCWIADVKSQAGLPMRKALNRKGVDQPSRPRFRRLSLFVRRYVTLG